MTEGQARRAIVEAGRLLLAGGFVARSWGNISIRLDEARMAITPSGIPYPELSDNMVVLVDLKDDSWSGDWKPSGERKVHREIYRLRPGVRAIVHTHQNAASACAAARSAVPCSWGQLRCATYALPGTKALTTAAVLALGQAPAVLLANHGVFVVGEDLERAFDGIRTVELACADYLEARAREPLPARADSPWEPTWLKPLVLAGGSSALLSTAPFTLAWSRRGLPLRASLDDLAQLAGPRVRAATSLPRLLPANGLLLVRDRGAILGGSDAEALAMVLEKAARAAVAGEGLGGAKAIPGVEALLMRWVYSHSYARQALKTAKPQTSG